jgi:hypothetical protein
MRQLDPDRNRDSESAPASQAPRLRQDIGRYRRRLAKIDPPETVRVLEDAHERRASRLEPAFSNAANPRR